MKEIEEMWTDLQKELAALDKEKNAIKRIMLSEKAARKAVERLEVFFVMRNEFKDDPSGLLNINRSLAPPFYAKFIYFSKVSAFEYLKLDENEKECEKLCKAELAGIKHFFKKHLDFRHYYVSGKTGRDTLYFQKEPPSIIELDELVVGISPDVNRGCLLVAYMKAFDDYTDYLTTAMQKRKTEPTIDSDLKWIAKPTDLNELVAVLEKHIEKGTRPVTLKELQKAFGNFLHVNLDNGAQLDNKRRNRVNEEPGFIEKLAEDSVKRKKKLTDKQESRKKRG